MKTNHKPQSILYPQPVLVIASYDKEGKADAMVAAWGGIYDTNQIGFMLDHHHQTTENIKESGAFTVSMMDPFQRRYLSIFYMPCGTFPGDLSDQLLLCPEEKISKQRCNISLLRRPDLHCHRLHHPPLCSLGRKSPP